ncbi:MULTISPECIES: hypothetical protein [unclassified Labrenzia]|uniref:hypothetical protein n=1 Tax=unclassified Labrenzia TaxID=2648686 RepID=UPI00126803B4|nr:MULTISPECIES: hypothetical protein [unclassified Labrenzia]
MSVPALVFDAPSVPIDPSDPATIPDTTPVTVRVHDQWGMVGDLKGTNLSYAEVSDNSPHIVFMKSEISPRRGHIVSVKPGVAYEVEYVDPPNGISITANVSRMKEAKTLNFPVPS